MIVLSSYALINTSVSYKYEIEPLLGGQLTDANVVHKHNLEEWILVLKILICFFIVNLGLGSYLIFKKNM
jgi:hypothetical protein